MIQEFKQQIKNRSPVVIVDYVYDFELCIKDKWGHLFGYVLEQPSSWDADSVVFKTIKTLCANFVYTVPLQSRHANT